MNDIEPRRTYLPSKRVVKLASAVLVLNSIGVWAVVSLRDLPNIEVEGSLKVTQPIVATVPSLVEAPAAPNGLIIR